MSQFAPIVTFLSQPVPQAVIWTAVLSVLVAVGLFVMKRFRDQSDDDKLKASELLTNFEEMHRGGDLSDAEYRTIKTALGVKLQQQLKDSHQKG